jgi:hypothetical protein
MHSRRWSRIFVPLVLFALGAVTVRASWPAVRLALEQRGWEEIACTMERAEVAGTSPELRLELRYRYRTGSEERTGSALETPVGVSHSDQTLRRLARELVPGTVVPCRVNPSDPSDAVLYPARLDHGVTLGFGIVMLIIGTLGLRQILIPPEPVRADDTGDDDEEQGEEDI